MRKILLATTVDWPSAARLAGAFVSLGACVEAVAPREHALHASRYPKHVHRYAPLEPAVSFSRAIRAAEPDLIIPCDDRSLAVLLQLGEFEALLRRSLGPLENYAKLTARAASIAAAREEGIAAPLTIAVPDPAALPEALAQVGLPCVIKSDASWGGSGVKVVETRGEAKEAYAELKGPPHRLRSLARAVLRKDLHFLHHAMSPREAVVNVQAFVPGRPATSVFAARDGKLLAALHMDVAVWSGATGPASRLRRVDCPQMENAARKIAARFKLNGLHGLDYVRDGQGVPHLIEINPRAAQICHLALSTDLPAALLELPPRPAVTQSRDIALFPQLLSGPHGEAAVYEDIPRDDPALLRAVAAGYGQAPGDIEYCLAAGPPDRVVYGQGGR